MCADGAVRTVSDVEVVDPICGMTIDVARAAASRASGDTTLYFCSDGCAAAFDRQQSRGGGGVLRPAVALHCSRRRASRAMAASTAVAAALTVGLLLAGLGSTALTIGAAVLLLSCLWVCAVAVWMQNRSLRELREAAEALAERRRAQRAP